MKLNIEYNKGILFVRVEGKLTKKTVHKINNFLIPAISKHKIKYLVYNLYGLTDIDESGINTLQNSNGAIYENSGEVYVCETPSLLKNKIINLNIKETANELSAINTIRI